MAEVKVGDHTYRVGRLDVFRQFHVARRLGAAAVNSLAAVAMRIERMGGIEAAMAGPKEALLPFAADLVQAIGSLSDADSNFVIDNCLSVVERNDAGRWARVYAGAGQLMYQDIDLAQMMMLIGRVLEENFGSFFGALLSLFPQEAGGQGSSGQNSQTAKAG